MVNRLRQFLTKEISGMHEAAYIIGAFAVASQLLAFIRDRVFAAVFGAGPELDVYYASFRIPDILFVTLASLVSVSVLVPYLINRSEKGQEERSRFVSSIAKAFLIAIIGISALLFFLLPGILRGVFPDLIEGAYGEDLITMSRILLISPVLLGVSNLIGAILQSGKRFVLYALSPLCYNLGIILGAIVLYPRMGLLGLAWGVAIGAALHMLIQMPGLASSGITLSLRHKIDWKEVADVARTSIPRTLALASGQLAILACVSVASALTAGSVAVFTLSYNLQSVPMSIVGVSYSLAAFPVLAELFAKGEKDGYLAHLATAARHIIFWSVPVVVVFVVLRAQIVRIILGSGEFTWNDTRLTAACLAFFAISVVAQSLALLFTRALYCAGSTKIPLLANMFSAVAIILLSITGAAAMQGDSFVRPLLETILKIEGVPGSSVVVIAAAYSVGMLLNAGILWIIFERRYVGFTSLFSTTARDSIVASIAMGIVSYLLLYPLSSAFGTITLFGILSQGILAGLGGAVAWLVTLYALRNEEIGDVLATIRSKVWSVRPVVDQTVDEL
jgi:putative peptidoglycan lipid II flippase